MYIDTEINMYVECRHYIVYMLNVHADVHGMYILNIDADV